MLERPLLRRLRLLKRRLRLSRLGLLGLGQLRRGSPAESWACGAANIAAARIDGARQMIRQTQPAGRYDYEKLRILKSTAL